MRRARQSSEFIKGVGTCAKHRARGNRRNFLKGVGTCAKQCARASAISDEFSLPTLVSFGLFRGNGGGWVAITSSTFSAVTWIRIAKKVPKNLNVLNYEVQFV